VELLKQPQYDPFTMPQTAISIWCGTTGQLDEVPTSDVLRFEKEFLDYLNRDHAAVISAVAETGQMADETVTALDAAIADFKTQFRTAEGTILGQEPEVKALEEEDIDQAKITKKVRKS
jgi:F-type H+-transporting ATPase subunit alpha